MSEQRSEGNWSRAVVWGLGVALMLIVIALSVNPAPANDLFWQLRFGRDISATGAPPRVDTYSWTRFSAPCVMHEWLTFVLFWQAYAGSGGFFGVWLLQAALTAATFGLLFALLLRETRHAPLTAFVLAAAAAVAAAPFFQPRPHLFTYLLLTLTAGVVLQVRRQPKRWRRLWCLPPLFALWANLHAGVLVGVLVLALCALGEMGEAYRQRQCAPRRFLVCRRRAARLLLAAALCAVATLVNPYGGEIYHNFVATIGNRAAMDTVVEWASPNFHDLSGKIVEGLVAFLLAGLAFSRKKREVAPILVTAVFAHAALMAFRNVPLFALIGLLLTARHLQSALMRVTGPAARRPLFGSAPPISATLVFAGTLSLIFLVLAAGRLRNAPETAGTFGERLARVTIALDSFPERACRFLEAQQLPRTYRLYNDYGNGGYLIWRLPQHPVFIDGRADLYFDRVLDDYLKIHKLAYQWQDVLGKYRADVALIAASTAQARLFLASPEWKLVYADENALSEGKNEGAMVFVRRLPEYAHIPEQGHQGGWQ